MTIKPKLSEMITALIEKTENPVAPLLIQKLADGIESGHSLFTTHCEQDKVVQIQERLLKDFPDTEINELSRSPEFITALLILLKTSIVLFTATPE